MRLAELAGALELEAIQNSFEDKLIQDGFTSDLLSDVMGKAKADSVLITIQAHKNTVAVASLAGICAIVVCSNRPIPDDMRDAARAEGIGLFRSSRNQFELSGRLWSALNR